MATGEVKDLSLLREDFAPGQLPSSPNTTVRAETGSIPLTCTDSGVGTFFCNGTATIKASCAAGEHATGGGYGAGNGADQFTPQEERPDPTTGTPDGWVVKMFASRGSSTASAPPAEVPIYAVCEA